MTPTPPALAAHGATNSFDTGCGDTGGGDPATSWLTVEQQEAWKAVALLLLQLPTPLDAQLQRDSGITFFEYMVLSTLSMAPGRALRMSELAELANGSLSRLSNVAKRLEGRGWLVRTPDPDDGRYTVAHLTDSGWAVVRSAAPGHVATVRRLLIEPLTATEVSVLAGIGRRVRDIIRCPDPAT